MSLPGEFELPEFGLDEPVLAAPAPRGLGAAMAGGGPKVARKGYDYYPTPVEVTRALLREERHCLHNVAPGPVWEPCGRGGAIVRELIAHGFETVASDIVADPEHDVEQADLLAVKRARARKVVTNPPFALAGEMVLHLLGRLKVDYLALLLKAQFWHAESRRALFRAYPPARIRALTWRADFLGKGAPTMDCCWFIWQRGCFGGPVYSLLPREADGHEGLL